MTGADRAVRALPRGVRIRRWRGSRSRHDSPWLCGELAWLSAPTPNPSRGTVSLRLRDDAAGDARATILDVRGRMVRDIGAARGGEFVWDGRDGDGRRVPGGIYFFRVETGEGDVVRRVVRVE
ncbi:MAG: FlgD immunoglobulin-like domain containing protein [Candidatus Eisenbacteria bacterium]